MWLHAVFRFVPTVPTFFEQPPEGILKKQPGFLKNGIHIEAIKKG
jgi:hypothetical protein